MNTMPAKAELPPPAFFTAKQVELIKRQICPGASDDELQMFLADCQRSRLDPFARQIYSVERREKYYDKQKGEWRWRTKRVTIVSIDGFRLTAERTGEYAGQLGPEWCDTDGAWRDVWLEENKNPAAARVAVLRKDFEKPLWTAVAFNEYCPRNDKGQPTGQWAKMPAVMIAKCAEAMSLRRAFPRELSGLYTSDEMMQAIDVTPRASLADEIGDEIPHQELHADPGSAAQNVPASAAAAATLDQNPPPAAAALSLEQRAVEAAKKGGGPAVLALFKSCSAKERAELKRMFGEAGEELVSFYPSPYSGDDR